jgi:hypothetical protein
MPLLSLADSTMMLNPARFPLECVSASSLMSEEEALRLVEERPRAIIDNRDPAQAPPPRVPAVASKGGKPRGLFQRLFGARA